MNVTVTPQQTSWIQRLIRSGRYRNQSEVLRDALRHLEEEAAGSAPTCAQLAEALEKHALPREEAEAFARDVAEYVERTNVREPAC